jgi:hypothetical protein
MHELRAISDALTTPEQRAEMNASKSREAAMRRMKKEAGYDPEE